MTTVGTANIANLPVVGEALSYEAFGVLDATAWQLETEALSLAILPGGWEPEEGFRLNSILLVQLKTNRSGILATTFLEAEEYGWGDTESGAILDLISSLVEYMASLEARRDHLANPGLADLKKLRQLFQPKTP